MSEDSIIVQEAEFNPRIKQYIFWYVALIMLATLVGIPLLLIWMTGFGQYICAKYYDHLKCSLTAHHLEFKKGAWFKVEKTIPLENIQDLTFIDNPLLRYFDLRMLKIETAGQSNPAGSDMTLVGIIGAHEFKQKVLKLREEFSKYRYSSSAKESASEKDPEIELLKEIRDLLKEIKNKN